jgi:hypothetical protein
MTCNGRVRNEEGRRQRRPWFVFVVLPRPLRSSDERGLAIRRQYFLVACLNRECVVLFLEPYELGFQVAYSLLETAHLGKHAGIGTADVAE